MVRTRSPHHKEETGFRHVERVRQWTSPEPLNTQSVGKPSVASYDSAVRFGTEMMVTSETFVTVETTVSRPTNADALADEV